MIPNCLCGNILRGETEQARGWCVDCCIQLALHEERVKCLLEDTQDAPDWNQIVSTMQQALRAERAAIEVTSFQQEGQPQAYCQVFHHIGESLSYWMNAEHQVWLLLLQIDTTQRTAWEDLHDWCIEERERVYMLYAMLNISVQGQCYASFFAHIREGQAFLSSVEPLFSQLIAH